MKIATVVGTRPELIRLSQVIGKLDQACDHVLIHTGQNYDFELSRIFFDDLSIRTPDFWLDCAGKTTAETIGSVLTKTDEVFAEVDPDAVIILGDTNSCLSAISAKKRGITVFHLEAGNRSFDPEVPEELNRKIVDIISDYNLVYSEAARRNLLHMGLPGETISLIGSPMREVIGKNLDKIRASSVLADLGLVEGEYIVLSVHREENTKDSMKLHSILRASVDFAYKNNLKIIAPTHPKTAARLREFNGAETYKAITFIKPLSFTDYMNLQMNSALVFSDSGTISEESAIAGFKAVTPRAKIERPESLESGNIIASGWTYESLIRSAEHVFEDASSPESPNEYRIENTSQRVVRFIFSMLNQS